MSPVRARNWSNHKRGDDSVYSDEVQTLGGR